jgi:hypothetical protein
MLDMANHVTEGRLLPRELLEIQLGQIDLLMAMYPGEGNVELTETANAAMGTLRQWLIEEPETEEPPSLPPAINLVLLLDAPEQEQGRLGMNLKLNVLVPIRYHGSQPPTDAPPAQVRLQQSSWMSKAETASFNAKIPQDSDLFTTIEDVNQHAIPYFTASSAQTASTSEPLTSLSISRVWFYFPSISTRSKRDDLVSNAPLYGLTGFLLAGKPGILCLEGDSQAVDDYMKFIKTESWGDIPAHHKKVSEKYRQSYLETRVFPDMQEITDQLERRGERANRNDMKALESWLDERGLGEAFSKVLI